MENLKIALIQADLAWENIEKNLQYFDERINAITAEIDLIILPEMFSTGFSMNAEILAEAPDGQSLNWMQQKARKLNVAITGSLIIKEKGHFYNRL